MPGSGREGETDPQRRMPENTGYFPYRKTYPHPEWPTRVVPSRRDRVGGLQYYGAMDKPNTHWLAGSTREETAQSDTSSATEASLARGSDQLGELSSTLERAEHSVMEGLPPAKAERIAAMRRELADLQRQLIDAQQRIATELQGRAEDAERFEALEARLQAQEAKAQRDAARIVELETEIASVRSLLANVTATAEELRRDVATRDAQIEEAQRQHRGVTEQLEAQTAALNEVKTQLESRDGELATRTAELATRTTERDTEQATNVRLERELEEQRTRGRELATQLEEQRARVLDLTTQLEAQFASLRDAKAVIATRDTELAAMTSERDVLKSELAAMTSQRDARTGELAAAVAKMRDVTSQLASFEKDLDLGVVQAPSSTESRQANAARSKGPSKPPPVPPPRGAGATHPPQILEVTEDAKPSSRIGLGLIAGLILGGAVTFAVVKWSNASSITTAERDSLAASPSAALDSDRATEPTTPSLMPVEGGEAPATDPTLPTPASDTDATARADDASDSRSAANAETATEGVIVLPDEASGHRVFVDGRVVRVRKSRAVVPCGSREIRIGSRGTPRTLDVACGGDTAVPAE
jgi:hypothetical protein